MRFGIRDLLILTTLAVVYAVAFAAMPAREWSKRDLIGLLPILGFLTPVFLAISCQRRVGRTELTISPRWAWWAHFGIALTGGCVLAFPYLAGQASNAASTAIGCLFALHCLVTTVHRTTLGERGVAIGLQWLPWDQYVFRLQGDRLRFQHRDYLDREPSRARGQWAFVPTDLAPEVRDILDRYQPVNDVGEEQPLPPLRDADRGGQ